MWSRNGKRPDTTLDRIKDSNVRVQSELEKNIAGFPFRSYND